MTTEKKNLLSVRSKLSHKKKFLRKFTCNQNEQKEGENEQLRLSKSIIFYVSKIVMYEYWYDYLKPKYGNNVKLYYMETGSFLVHVETKKACAELAEKIEIRFNKSNDGVDKPLPILKSRKGIRLMKDKLDGRLL